MQLDLHYLDTFYVLCRQCAEQAKNDDRRKQFEELIPTIQTRIDRNKNEVELLEQKERGREKLRQPRQNQWTDKTTYEELNTKMARPDGRKEAYRRRISTPEERNKSRINQTPYNQKHTFIPTRRRLNRGPASLSRHNVFKNDGKRGWCRRIAKGSERMFQDTKTRNSSSN